MKILSLCLLLVGWTIVTTAQVTTPAGSKTTLRGTIRDANGIALPFASVALLNAKDSSLVKGGLSNEAGKYELPNVAAGRYLVAGSMVGYKTVHSAAFEVTLMTAEVPSLSMAETAKTLNEVTVVAQKPVFEQQLDKLVVNVQSIVTAAGSSALDVLERSPGVTVNRQNNALTLAGKSGVVVMVNGKTSRLPMEAVMQMLTGTNASNVEKIELITNPSARFDAEGDTGIINIILKKNTAYGTNGSYTLSAGYGFYEKLNGSVNLNHRVGKLNLYGDLSGQRNRGWRKFLSDYDITNAGMITKSLSDLIGYQSPGLLNARLGFDYSMSKRTTIGGLVSGFMNDFTATNNSVSVFFQRGDLWKQTRVQDLEQNNWKHGMVNVNLNHAFTDKQRLSVDVDYLRYSNEQTHVYTNFFDFRSENRTLTELVNTTKTTPISILVLKADYTQNPGAKATLDFGVKATLMGLKNNVLVERQQQTAWKTDPDFSQNYDLTDNILAGYVNFQQMLSTKTKLQTGLRYEHTHTDIGPPGEPLVVRRRYGSLFPSLFISHDLSKSSSVQLSYSRRIQRPSYDLLAPWILFTSPYAFVTGNPKLLPTFTDAVQATYRFKSNYLLTVKYSHDRNALDRFRIRVDTLTNRSYVTPENVASLNTFSLTFSFPVKVTDWWQMQTNLLGVWQSLSTTVQDKPFQLQQYNANLFTSHTFKLPKGFTGELTTFYQTPGLSGISKMQAFGSVNAGVKKKLKGNSGSLLLNITDIFWTNRLRFITDNPAVNQVGNWSLLSEPRVIRLTYSRNYCNIVGLKPTHGLTSLRGVMPFTWSFFHVGPLGRTVEDTAILLQAIAGYDPLDPSGQQVALPNYQKALSAKPTSLRIGLVTQKIQPNKIIADKVSEAVEVFRSLGATAGEVTLPDSPPAAGILFRAEDHAHYEPLIKANPNLFSADFAKDYTEPSKTTADQLIIAYRELTLARRGIQAIFDTVDVLMFPTRNEFPPLITDVQNGKANGQSLSVGMNIWSNLFGLPSVSIPCGFTPEGLPVGLQIIGPHFGEAAVLAVANQYQQATSWHKQHPPIL